MNGLLDAMKGVTISEAQNGSVCGQDSVNVANLSLVEEKVNQHNERSNDEFEPTKTTPIYVQNRPKRKTRDPTWLQVEVCREYLRGECTRSLQECKFAHPKPTCMIENGRVTTCYDSLKERCIRERCKYFHPPKHIKNQIQSLGRSYQKSDYNHCENDFNNHLGYTFIPTFAYWFPWNPYIGTEAYQYGQMVPNYDYNYFEIPQNDIYTTNQINFQGSPPSLISPNQELNNNTESSVDTEYKEVFTEDKNKIVY